MEKLLISEVSDFILKRPYKVLDFFAKNGFWMRFVSSLNAEANKLQTVAGFIWFQNSS